MNTTVLGKPLWSDIFPSLCSSFFRAVHAGIDWNREVTFLDKALQKIIRDAELGRRYVDKLVQVWRTDGDESWVCIHIEVQAEYESDFANRPVLQVFSGELPNRWGISRI